jgi:hypothetical protein
MIEIPPHPAMRKYTIPTSPPNHPQTRQYHATAVAWYCREWTRDAGESPGIFGTWRISRVVTVFGMSTVIALAPVSWQRMAEGIENVKVRFEKAANALNGLGVRPSKTWCG